MNFEGFILVGGKSSRMGADKFALTLNYKTFLEIAFNTLREAKIDEIKAVISLQTNSQLPFPTIKDIYPNRGALSGIHSALFNSKADWTIILACDYPFVTVDLIELLKKFAKAENSFDAFVPIQKDGRIQPLCAIYKTENCLKILAKMLANSDENYSVREFLTRLKTYYIEFAEIAALPDSDKFFFNVNSPADYEKAKSWAEVSIAKMTIGDIQQIICIQADSGLDHWSSKDYEGEVSRADSFAAVAKFGGETAGFLVGRFIKEDKFAELYNIGVDANFRRKKIGNALLKSFIKHCVSNNLEKIFLEVRESNETAIRFYLKNNFAVIGNRKNFYSNPTENAVLMSLKLSRY